MNTSKFTNIVSLIVILAIITTVVAHRGSSHVITSLGRAFSGSVRAAMGQ